MLVRTHDVWNITQQRQWTMLCAVCSSYSSLLVFTGLCWHCFLLMLLWHWLPLPSLLIIICSDFIERNAPASGGILAASGTFCRLNLIGRASLVFFSGSNCHCWLMSCVSKQIELALLIHVNWPAAILTVKTEFTHKNYLWTGSNPPSALFVFPCHYFWWVIG